MSPADLFTWREEADAAQAVAAAEALRALAERKRRVAPHGEVRNRQARLEAATAAALRAEVELERVQREERP
ncbi:hypothetical protein [Phenylobacterium sp.]|uniref:hypothetical protein n=1 Tax=Phenylobacterium sp. TaxID=1871053 RepID=UPI0035B4BCA7